MQKVNVPTVNVRVEKKIKRLKMKVVVLSLTTPENVRVVNNEEKL
jgi:hypothetical protein